MKKTLMVLSFALCATLAFAQTQNVTSARVQKSASAAAVQSNDNAGYKASIFTKDDEPIKTWEFNANNAGYQIHQIGNGEYVGGQLLVAHSQTADHARWQRFSGTAASDMTEWGNSYPYTISNVDAQFRANNGFGFFEYYMDDEACSSNNGFMVMTMQDQITAWGGHGNAGNFHSAICLEGFSTTDVPVFAVRMFQYYKKFNADSCFIDYSTDSSTWNALQINIKNIDVAVNGSLWGIYQFTLPAAATGNQANVYLRLRWDSHSNGGGAYGYIWMLDDVKIIPGRTSNWTNGPEKYLSGAYHIMPQGLDLPISWNTTLTNNGVINQTNVAVNMYNINNGAATTFATMNAGTLNAGATEAIVIDDAGFYDASYPGWGRGYSNNPATNARFMPTNNLGENFVTTTITSDSLTTEFDTIIYQVNAENDGSHIWGYDNGVLTRRTEQLFHEGLTTESYNDEGEFYTAGYSVSLRYKTGANIPAGWVIRGVELVASNYMDEDAGYYPSREGTMVAPTLRYDSLAGESVYFVNVEHGGDVHTVQASELNDTATIGTASAHYLTYGNYNTVRIEFPNQPELRANTSYRIGYELAQNGNFGVATIADRYTYTADGEEEIMRFANDTINDTKKFANTFGLPCAYDLYFIDPVTGESGWGSFATTPMIRMIVGPRIERPNYNVAIECEHIDGASGEVSTATSEDLCGQTATVSEGARTTFYMTYGEGDALRELLIDGVAVEPYDEETGEGDENFIMYRSEDETGAISYYYGYTFRNMAANHTVKAVFGPETGSVNSVESHVAMNLVPNPATSQVKLSIAGVSGMVDLNIIDMSGRVVMSKKVNAETMQAIDLSGFAKGAYFVRVTNNNFSKVEKLIVR